MNVMEVVLYNVREIIMEIFYIHINNKMEFVMKSPLSHNKIVMEVML